MSRWQMSRFSPGQSMVPALVVILVVAMVVAVMMLQPSPRYGVEFGNPCKTERLLTALYTAGIPFEFDGRYVWVDDRNRQALKSISSGVDSGSRIGCR